MVSSRQMQGAALVATALIILVFVGLIINNMSNAGLINPSQSQTCSSNPGTPICTLNSATGCQITAANCNLSGSSINLLNSCSPFTNILTLNYVGFVSSFNSNCGKFVSQVTNPNATTIVGQNAGNQSFTSCSHTIAEPFGLGAIGFQCATANPPLSTLTAPFHFGCGQFLVTIGNLTVIPHHNATLTTCNMSDSGASQITLASFSCYLYGVYNATSPSPKPQIRTAICNGNTFVSYSINASTGLPTASTILNNSLVSFLGFIVGAIVLILVGFGIHVGALSFSAGSNPQGSKLAQTYGIGLLIWSPLYSEFSPWFTSGYLPYGLDGVIGGVSVGLIVCFFFGLYFLSQSGTAAAQ